MPVHCIPLGSQRAELCSQEHCFKASSLANLRLVCPKTWLPSGSRFREVSTTQGDCKLIFGFVLLRRDCDDGCLCPSASKDCYSVHTWRRFPHPCGPRLCCESRRGKTRCQEPQRLGTSSVRCFGVQTFRPLGRQDGTVRQVSLTRSQGGNSEKRAQIRALPIGLAFSPGL